MSRIFQLLLLTTAFLYGCGNKTEHAVEKTNMTVPADPVDISCKLSSPELQKRKETVLEDLKRAVLEKKELPDGYSYKFNGSDSVYIRLTDFIRSERKCCGFFQFNLQVSAEKNFTWLDITGPAGTKAFIASEADL